MQFSTAAPEMDINAIPTVLIFPSYTYMQARTELTAKTDPNIVVLAATTQHSSDLSLRVRPGSKSKQISHQTGSKPERERTAPF